MIWRRVKKIFGDAVAWARYAEPAELRANWLIVLGFTGAMGLTVPGVVDRWVGAGIAAFTVLAPYLQGQLTRRDAWSQRGVDDLTALVALYPHAAEEIKRLLGQGLDYRIVREHVEAEPAPKAAPRTTHQARSTHDQ